MDKPQEVNKFQQLGRVKVIKGSILTPENAGLRFVLSVNNLLGKAEGNPLLPLFDKKWPKVRQESRGWYATKTGAYKLGAVSESAVQSDVWVMHLLCQGEDLTVDAAALEKCLKEVCKRAKYERATVHVSTVLTNSIPEFTGLLQSQLIDQGVSVSFYEELTA
jgi:hypothetical protein